ncbi:MAG: AraC family transcriptional regulator [Chloroflexota bacterium]
MRSDYIKAINRAMDFVEKNLFEDLTLEQVSREACFSQFYFSRIFKSITGETLFGYIQRLRLERAADLICQGGETVMSEVAWKIGFSSPASFTRAFREKFGCAPSEWKAAKTAGSENGNFSKENSKIGIAEGNLRKEIEESPYYFSSESKGDFLKTIWRFKMKEGNVEGKFEVRELPKTKFAYIRHIGPYAGDENLFGRLFGSIMRWAGPKGLVRFPETKMMTIYHDNPDITPPEKFRISVGMTVPENVQPEGEIGVMDIEGGLYGVGTFEIDPKDYGAAWNMVYGGFLPESGYKPDERACFEVYLNDPRQHPEGKHIVEIYAPIKK